MFGGRFVKMSMPVAMAIVLAGCGSGESELTTEEMLQKLAGHALTPSEVVEQLELADLLCGFEPRVLEQIWVRLDARQLEFQDYVFGLHCPERMSVYAAARPSTGSVAVDTTSSTTSGEPSTANGRGPGSSRSTTSTAPDSEPTTTGGSGTTARSTTTASSTTASSTTASPTTASSTSTSTTASTTASRATTPTTSGAPSTTTSGAPSTTASTTTSG